MLTLKKLCIKTTLKAKGLNYDGLPKTLKDEILNAKNCCVNLSAKDAFFNGHYGCFVEAYNGPLGDRYLVGKCPDEVHLTILQYIRSRDVEPLTKDHAYSAAKHGHVKTLEYLKDILGGFNLETIYYAAGSCSLPCLMYCHTNYLDDGYNCSRISVCKHAVQSGSLDCLQYALNQGYPFENNFFHILCGKSYEIFLWATLQESPNECEDFIRWQWDTFRKR